MTTVMRSFQELAEHLEVPTFDDAIRLFLEQNDNTQYGIIADHLRPKILSAARRACNEFPSQSLLDDCLQVTLLTIVSEKDHVLRAQNTAAYTAVLARHATEHHIASENAHYRRMQYGGDFGEVRFRGHFDPQTYAENKEGIHFLLEDLPNMINSKHAAMVAARLVEERSYSDIGTEYNMKPQVVRGTLSKKFKQLLEFLSQS